MSVLQPTVAVCGGPCQLIHRPDPHKCCCVSLGYRESVLQSLRSNLNGKVESQYATFNRRLALIPIQYATALHKSKQQQCSYVFHYHTALPFSSPLVLEKLKPTLPGACVFPAHSGVQRLLSRHLSVLLTPLRGET